MRYLQGLGSPPVVNNIGVLYGADSRSFWHNIVTLGGKEKE
jgi:hypothetical protein